MVSTTLTNCSAFVVFPDVSVTVHVTIVSPSGKNSGALFDNVSIAILSNTVGSNKITSFSVRFVASNTISSG